MTDSHSILDHERPAKRTVVSEGKTWRGLAEALDVIDIRLRWNTRRAIEEWEEGRSGDWSELNDRSSERIFSTIADRCAWKNSQGKQLALKFGRTGSRIEALHSLLYGLEVDPFLEWLRELEERECWDPADADDSDVRFSTVLPAVLDADPDDPLVVWASRFIFLGPIQRTLNPGAKLDEMPILKGPEGIGKSALLRSILPDPSYFGDGLGLHDQPKQQVEAMLGRVIVEIAEMAGHKHADRERLKAFISRQDDGSVRQAYARRPERLPRRCVFVGSTNEDRMLPDDPAGNRRFVVIETPGVLRSSGKRYKSAVGSIEHYMAERRDSLWAEALYHYRMGMRANLPRDLHDRQAQANFQYRKADPIEALLDKLDEELTSDLVNWQGISLAKIYEKLDIQKRVIDNPAIQSRLLDAMKQRGWTKKRVTRLGRKVTLWYSPDMLDAMLDEEGSVA